MPRYRSRGMALRPVNRIKHVVDFSGTLAKGVQFNLPIVQATDTPTLADTDGVETGAKVNGVYIHLEVASNDPFDAGVIPNFFFELVKNPGGNITLPSPAAVGGNDNKRFVIHQEMVMLNNLQGGNPRVVFNGVIVIPKGYRRFAPNDQLSIGIICPALDIVFCWQTHYKEFR